MSNIIIKNKNKFDRIKLAKGIYLDKFKSQEDIVLRFFYTPQGKLYFKDYDKKFFGTSTTEMRMANELICFELGKQLGLNMAKYETANYKNKTGLVSYDIREHEDDVIIDGEQLVEIVNSGYPSNTFKEYIQTLNTLKNEHGYNIDVEKTSNDLYKLLVFDSLTFQEDRHDSNILFLYNEKNNTIKLAPILDNEFAFGGFQENVVYDEKGIAEKSFLYSHSINLDYVAETIPITSLTSSRRGYIDNINNIVKIAAQDEQKKEILVKMLTNVNFRQAIDNVRQKGHVIPSDYELYLLELEKLAKKCYKKQIDKQRKKDDFQK